MKKRTIILTLILCFSLFFSSCKQEVEKKRYEASFLTLFNTVTTIVGYSDDKEAFSADIQNIYDDLEEYHKLYDIYNDYDGMNNLKTINDNAGISPVKVDKKIINLLVFGKEMYHKTNGKVNIAYGSVLKLWHEYRTQGIDDPVNAKLPPFEELLEREKHTDIENIIIDKDNSTVFLADKDMSLDVGAVGKGYATEQVCKKAQQMGVESLLVSVGGNVRAIGGKDEAHTPWDIGIQNPDASQDKYLFSVLAKDMSIVTSGDYKRYYTVDGKQYHHIIDPETLMPSDYYEAVTVICESSGLADGLSTALYNMPLAEGKELLNSMENIEAVWVGKSGEINKTDGFDQFVKQE